MSKCAVCGRDLTGAPCRAAADVTLTDFLQDKPTAGEPMARQGDPDYDEHQGYLICECGRHIPITPKMVNNSGEYDEL